MLRASTVLVSLSAALAADNGRAITPPMGWRSWNLYGKEVTQDLIESVMDGMVSKKRLVDGKPTSLCDLGYCDVGLDDNWQACGSGAGNKKFHDADGNPIINTDRFPDLSSMTSHAHKLGLTAGWYGNNCICREHHTSASKFYEGDVKALDAFGFDGVKLDGCGAQTDMEQYYELMNQSGRAITIENCHWGRIKPYEPNATWCPWNFFRTSGDVRASYASVVGNLQTVTKYAETGLSRPGCWAYPDMLEVGCAHGPGGENDPGLSPAETRAHFGAWAIVSSPLTLSHDVNNDTIMDAIWPLIANPEAIAVNQIWAGSSGGPFKASSRMLQLSEVNFAAAPKSHTAEELKATGPTLAPEFQYYYKPIGEPGVKTAVLLMNHGTTAVDLVLDFKDIPLFICSHNLVRDIWARSDIGDFHDSFTAKAVGAHDAAFLVISCIK